MNTHFILEDTEVTTAQIDRLKVIALAYGEDLEGEDALDMVIEDFESHSKIFDESIEASLEYEERVIREKL